MDPWMLLSDGFHIIKRKMLRYSLILLLCNLFAVALNLFVSYDFMMEQPQWLIPYLALALFLIVVRNTVYIVFIKAIRKEAFQKEDINWSFHKVLLHILTVILFEILQLGLSYIVLMIGQIVPILALPAAILIQGAITCVTVFIAFAIYDGGQGAVMIVNGSFRMLGKHLRTLTVMAMPLVIWMLVYQLLYQTNIAYALEQNIQMSWATLADALNQPTIPDFVMNYLGLELLNVLVCSVIQCILFSGFALVYESEYRQFYTFPDSMHTIDHSETNDAETKNVEHNHLEIHDTEDETTHES